MQTEIAGTLLIYLLTLLLAWPLGKYIAAVYSGKRHFSDVLRPFERLLYRLGGVDEQASMNWKQFLKAMLTINMLWLLYAFVLLLFQDKLPLNTEHTAGQTPDHGINTASSFHGNCNRQH